MYVCTIDDWMHECFEYLYKYVMLLICLVLLLLLLLSEDCEN